MFILLLVSLALPTAKQTAWFDFAGPREDQSGQYSIVGDALLEENSAHLSEAMDWYAPGWSHRIKMVLSNQSGQTLPYYPVRIDLATLPAELFDLAHVSGRDLRLFLDDGTEVTRIWLEYFNFISMEGTLWFRMDSIPQGTSNLHLYFGNQEYEGGGSWEEIFSFPQAVEGGYWFYPENAQARVIPMEDAIDFQVGDATPLTLDPAVVTSLIAPAGPISASGPYAMWATNDCSDTFVPYSMAGTLFVYPAQRSTDVFHLYSPTGTASVTLATGAGTLATVTVDDATTLVLNQDVAGVSYFITSDLPIVAFHETVEANDGHPLLPAATELWGGATGTIHVAALNDNTTVTASWSDGTQTTHIVNSTGYVTLPNAGAGGDGPAVHLEADGPIGAIANGDGNGGEAIAFLPRAFLGTRYRFPMNGSYLFITAKDAATHCTIESADGTPLATDISTSYPPPFANRIFFTTQLTAGNHLVCDGPVAAYMEEASLADERHLTSVTDHRPLVSPAPQTTVSGTTSAPHFSLGPATVVTPTLSVPLMITAWDEILFYEPTDIPEDTAITYQVSQDGGTTWLYFDGSAWVPVTSLYDANTPAWLAYAFPLLEPLPWLTFKIILSGEGGDTPVQGPMSVSYIYTEGADNFFIETIPSPQAQGQAFTVTIEARDPTGRRLTGYNSPLGLSIVSSGTTPRFSPMITPALVNGRISFKFAVLDPAEQIALYVTDGSTSAQSNTFDVTRLDTTGLVYIAGDGQWGMSGEPLPSPLVVRVLNEAGNGVAFQYVTFEVTGGDGVLETGARTMNVETDEYGFAEIAYLPGMGLNTVQASMEGIEDTVLFTLRGDEGTDTLTSAEGGNLCSASAGGSSSGSSIPLMLLIGLALVAVIRRRPR